MSSIRVFGQFPVPDTCTFLCLHSLVMLRHPRRISDRASLASALRRRISILQTCASPGEVRTWAGSADGRNNGTCSATLTRGLPFSSTAVLVASRVATSGVYTSWACRQIWICRRNALRFSRTSAFCFDVFAFLLERSSRN